MKMSWIQQGGIIFLLMMVRKVSGMDSGSSSMSVQISMLGSQLSNLGSQMKQLQEQVEALHQENMEDKQRIVHLEQVTHQFERRVSLLESLCGSAEMETEIKGPLMAIGGYDGNPLSSAEVVNTSCDFPLPETRHGHISVTTTDGKTLVCGGHTGTDYTASCLQFDYESKSWKEHSTLLSNYRHYSSAVTLSRGAYVLGGQNYAASSSEFLATGSSVWTQGPHLPGLEVYRSCVAKVSDTEFVIISDEYVRTHTQALVYNEESEEWREWPPLTDTSGHSCIGLGDTVLMAGGVIDGDVTGRTVIFDTKTGSSREVASLKYPRVNAEMVVYRGKPVILGGSDGNGVRRSDGEMWNMDTETWEEADIHLNIGRQDFTLVTMAEEIDCN